MSPEDNNQHTSLSPGVSDSVPRVENGPPEKESGTGFEETKSSSPPSSETERAEAVAAESAAQDAGSPEPAAEESVGSDSPAEPVADDQAVTAQELNQLIDQYDVPQGAPAEGEMTEGTVVALTDLGVVVDIGAKTEGLIPAQEFTDAGVSVDVGPGQKIEVQPTGQHKDGYLLLSYLRARRKRIWEQIDKAYRANQTLTGKVVDRIKGGLVVDIGVRAFLPASQIDLRPTRDVDSWKDQNIEVRVLKMNRKRGNVVVSRRVILEEEQRAVREKKMGELSEGAVVSGTVKNIADYGVFVDLGGLDGLLHITDLSWGRVTHPSDVVSAGQQLEAKILKFDREKQRVSLGLKQLQPDPWDSVPVRYASGARVTGRVVGITDYGAFVEVEPGVEGLVHVSEMTWSKRMRHPSKMVKIGDEVEAVILDLRPDQRRISLGLKQAQPDPWESLAEKYPVGAVISGKIRNLTDFGAFVEVEDGIDGLIHVSDISWSQRVKHPSEAVKKGQTIEAKVLKIDKEHRRLSLGIKQVNDIWSDWYVKHPLGSPIRGRVSRLTTFGAFVDLGDGIEGLCHISEIEDRRSKNDRQQGKGNRSSISLDVGQEYDFKIIKINPDEHKIGLSYRAAQKQAERKEMEEYRSSKSSATATIGDVLLSKRESMS